MVDAHTHHSRPDHRQLLVLDPTDMPSTLPNSPFCIGMHPWKADQFEPSQMQAIILQNSSNPNFIALGEFGLDRAANHKCSNKQQNWQQQINCFEWQLQFACDNKLPRIVLHSVRAYSDILGLIKASDYQGKVLWHDFNGNQEMLQQLLNINSFFSIGAKVFQKNCKIHRIITQIPKARLLLETDDQTAYSLDEIYTQTAKLLNVSKAELIHCTNQSYEYFLA